MNDLLQETAEKLGLPFSTVETVIKIYFSYIRYKISSIPYRNLTTFEGVKTNFSLMGFGKLVVKNKTEKRLQNEKRFKITKRKVTI